jgi:predicted NBD/HSP70 family sugar kinase
MATTGTDPGRVLDLVRHGLASTRAELSEQLGWSRLTIARRLDQLVGAGLLMAAGSSGSTGGRPPESFQVDPTFGTLLVADIGGSKSRVAVADFAGRLLVSFSRPVDVAAGPAEVLGWIRKQMRRLLAQAGRSPADVVALGIGVPGPVDTRTGRVAHPSIMPGWDGVDVGAALVADYPQAAVVLDRDVNIMALGEYRSSWRDYPNIVVVKFGHGIGCGLVLRGEVYRGAIGVAGDIGHLYRGTGRPCRCGRIGCLEASAAGWAIAGELQAAGRQVATSDDVADLAMSGDELALRLVAEAGTQVGEALADVVCVANPSIVVVGGNLARVGAPLLDPLRSSLRARAPETSIAGLEVLAARLGIDAGITGASLSAQDAACRPGRLEEALRRA